MLDKSHVIFFIYLFILFISFACYLFYLFTYLFILHEETCRGSLYHRFVTHGEFGLVCRLLQSLYSLKQSQEYGWLIKFYCPAIWHASKWGRSFSIGNCIFLIVYVNNIVITCENYEITIQHRHLIGQLQTKKTHRNWNTSEAPKLHNLAVVLLIHMLVSKEYINWICRKKLVCCIKKLMIPL